MLRWKFPQSLRNAAAFAAVKNSPPPLSAVSFIKGVDIDLHDYLFGDISAVTTKDLIIIWIGAMGVLALVAWRWSALLTATLNEDLAYASGINP